MTDIWQRIIERQFGAAVQMLKGAIEACPETVWDDRSDGTPFWHTAYHTLFYLDLYLSESVDAFTPSSFHTENANILRDMPFPPYRVETPEQAYSKVQLLDYLEVCARKCRHVIRALTEETIARRSPFSWLDMTLGDTMLYNMRHVQHHAAQLNIILRRTLDKAPSWVGKADLE